MVSANGDDGKGINYTNWFHCSRYALWEESMWSISIFRGEIDIEETTIHCLLRKKS
jgi:hypothetical protein